jgi:putative sporulation protein YyaC
LPKRPRRTARFWWPDAPQRIAGALDRVVPWYRPVAFLCIGSPEIPWDAYGPMVGTLLRNLGVAAYGTLEEPADSTNYASFAKMLVRKGYTLIIVDSANADPEGPHTIGDILVAPGPVAPGTAVPIVTLLRKPVAVGEACIGGVCSAEKRDRLLINTHVPEIRKRLFAAMARTTANGILEFLRFRGLDHGTPGVPRA